MLNIEMLVLDCIVVDAETRIMDCSIVEVVIFIKVAIDDFKP